MDGLIALAIAKGYTKEQIEKLSNLGRALAYWDCTTGKPDTNPGTLPYAYKTGDYYRVGKVAAAGGTNYKPDGSSYTGAASTTVDTDTVEVGYIYMYDGAVWISRPDGATSFVSFKDQSLTDNEKTQARTNIGAASYTYSSTAPTTLDENTIHFVV